MKTPPRRKKTRNYVLEATLRRPGVVEVPFEKAFPKNIYAKIVFDNEGVVFEKKYKTEAEARAFVDGFKATVANLDPDDDCHFACVDSEPATEEA